MRTSIATSLLICALACNLNDARLIDAAKAGDLGAVEEALKQGARLEARDQARKTALSYAVEQGHVKVVALLLQRGADATPAMLDICDGKSRIKAMLPGGSIVKAFMKQHAGEGDNVSFALAQCSASGSYAAVQQLLSAGANPNGKSDSRSEMPHYDVPLLAAAGHGHARVVALLLEKGARIPKLGTEQHSIPHEIGRNYCISKKIQDSDFDRAGAAPTLALLEKHGVRISPSDMFAVEMGDESICGIEDTGPAVEILARQFLGAEQEKRKVPFGLFEGRDGNCRASYWITAYGFLMHQSCVQGSGRSVCLVKSDPSLTSSPDATGGAGKPGDATDTQNQSRLSLECGAPLPRSAIAGDWKIVNGRFTLEPHDGGTPRLVRGGQPAIVLTRVEATGRKLRAQLRELFGRP